MYTQHSSTLPSLAKSRAVLPQKRDIESLPQEPLDTLPQDGVPDQVDVWFQELVPYRQLLRKQHFTEAEEWLNDRWKSKLIRTSFAVVRNEQDAKQNLQVANAVLLNRVSIQNMPEIDLGWPINWFSYSSQDLQATNHLAYMAWINPLAWAYSQTADEVYAEKWLQIVENFLEGHAYGCGDLLYLPSTAPWSEPGKVCNSGEGFYASGIIGPWISLACHARMDNWLAGLSHVAKSQALTYPRLLRILTALMGDHARIIVNNPRSNTPNQFIANTLSLLKITMMFPEFKCSTGYYRIAENWVKEYLLTFLLPDGSDREQSLNYNMALARQLSALLAITPESAAELRGELRRAGAARLRFLTRVCTPSLRLPAIAKTHSVDISADLKKWAEDFQAPDVVALANGDGHGVLPASASAAYPYGGYYILRDSWSSNAVHLLFKASEMGLGHMHEDTLHLTLAAGGQDLIVDSSHYNYNDAQAVDRGMRDYCQSSWAHASILVDGGGQVRMTKRNAMPTRALEVKRLKNVAVESTNFALSEGVYADGFEGCPEPISHYRQIVWIKKHGFLIHDVIQTSKSHLYTQCWPLSSHFQRDDVQIDESQSLIRSHAAGADLSIQQILGGTVSIQCHYGEDGPMRGWSCPAYNQRIPKCDIHMQWRGDGPQQILTWISPGFSRVKSTVSSGSSTTLLFDNEEKLEINATLGEFMASLALNLKTPTESSVFSTQLEFANGLPSQCETTEKWVPIPSA